MKIPQDQWERPNPGCQRHRCSLAEPFVSSVDPATRTTQQAARQERIACHPTLQKTEKRIGKQYNGAHNREGELKDCSRRKLFHRKTTRRPKPNSSPQPAHSKCAVLSLQRKKEEAE